MRNFLFFFSILLSLPILTSCKTNGEEEKVPLDYVDFIENKLEWKNLFLPAKPMYFVYIYSNTCGHCRAIKDSVLSWANERRDQFYLTEYSQDIPIIKDTKNTLGACTYEQVGILGTPTLLQITDHVLTYNMAGENEILSFLNLTKSG